MSLEQDAERGHKAKKLIEDPLLAEARAEVLRVIHEAWERAPIRDRDGMHELKLMVKALSDVWALLEQALMDGRLAVEELEQRRSRVISPAEFKRAFKG